MNKVEQRLKKEFESFQRGLEAFDEYKEQLKPIIEGIEKIDPEIDMYWDGVESDLIISFTGNKHRLAEVVRVLRINGWVASSQPPKSNDSSWGSYFIHAKTTATVWLYFTSSVCRRVQVGTQMVEQPIWGVRCEEDLDSSQD